MSPTPFAWCSSWTLPRERTDLPLKGKAISSGSFESSTKTPERCSLSPSPMQVGIFIHVLYKFLLLSSRSRIVSRCESCRSLQLLHECRRKEEVRRPRSSQEILRESELQRQHRLQLQERFPQRRTPEVTAAQRESSRQVYLLQLSENRSFRQKLPRAQENRANRVNRYSNRVKTSIEMHNIRLQPAYSNIVISTSCIQ